MTSRGWKISVIVIVLLIAFTVEFESSFHSFQVTGETQVQSTNSQNGTLVVIEALPSYYLKIHATFQFSGIQNGPATVYLPNGTFYTVDNSDQTVTLNVQINGNPSNGLGSQNVTYGIGVNLSQKTPINGRTYSDISFSSFSSGVFSESYFSPANSYVFFVSNKAIIDISVVGMHI